MYYLGIDVHKDGSHVAVLDDDGEVVREGRVNATLDEVAEEYAGAQAAIEATSNYYIIYDTLDEHLDVVVADPAQTKAIGYAEVKNDRLDAKLRAASPIRYDRPELRSSRGTPGAPRTSARAHTIGRETHRLQERSPRAP
jgi:transposase